MWEGGLTGGRFYEQLGEVKGDIQDDFQFSRVGKRDRGSEADVGLAMMVVIGKTM